VFDRVLVANRGEIACRIIHVARSLGISTVAVYSHADVHMPFVRLADEAHLIEDTPLSGAYMRGEAIIDVALRTRASALHPGYGFLSERADFARLCEQAGLIFVGPHSSVIERLGLKDEAKRQAVAVSIPIIEGYYGREQEREILIQEAKKLGTPLMIKPVAGGGGRGMRRVEDLSRFEEALDSAQREAQSVFGDHHVLLERLLLAPRHIECQILADTHGHVIHLFERDCSLQRRHQKVIEEAPAPNLSQKTRHALGEASVALAKHVGYVGAGTVEFLVESSNSENFYFMEMNTRLQVEHPVTEEVTGCNLIEWQLRIAAGEPLTLRQEDIKIKGCAIEARLYAEDPNTGFLPSTGTLGLLELPHHPQVRVETGVEAGVVISELYDPMVAKIIAKGSTREEALSRLDQSLQETVVVGVTTNSAFLRTLCQEPQVQAGSVDIGFIDRHLDTLCPPSREPDLVTIKEALAALVDSEKKTLPLGEWQSPWDVIDGFSLMEDQISHGYFLINGREKSLRLVWNRGHLVGVESYRAEKGECHSTLRTWVDQHTHTAFCVHSGYPIRLQRACRLPLDGTTFSQSGDSLSSTVHAPLHGRVLAVLVHEGRLVDRGQPLVVLEAMKMEHTLVAPCAGIVRYGLFAVGASVSQGMMLAEILDHEREGSVVRKDPVPS